MTQKENRENHKQQITDGLEICPYLKWREDQTVRYGFPHMKNYCHKSKKAQPIKFSHQKEFCLNCKYLFCSVYQLQEVSLLPREIRGKYKIRRTKTFNPKDLIIPLSIAVGILVLFLGFEFIAAPLLGLDNNYYSPKKPRDGTVIKNNISGSKKTQESKKTEDTPLDYEDFLFKQPSEIRIDESQTIPATGTINGSSESIVFVVPITGYGVTDDDAVIFSNSLEGEYAEIDRDGENFPITLYGWHTDSFPQDYIGNLEEDSKSLFILSKDLESKE